MPLPLRTTFGNSRGCGVMAPIDITSNCPQWTTIFVLICILAPVLGSTSAHMITGTVITCDNEGEEVVIPRISDDPCISCRCMNGEVVCNKETCPHVKGCYLMLQGANRSCCDVCKGCFHEGSYYVSGAEWTDKNDPCRKLACVAGVVTEYRPHCRPNCRNPVHPAPGQCCPSCAGCIVGGVAYAEGDTVTEASEGDPCVHCKCLNGSITCMKIACPVLPCLRSKFIQRPDSCCPECKGSRRVFDIRGRCILGLSAYRDGQNVSYDQCTECRCNESTLHCKRTVCPSLACPPSHQVLNPDECCPRCQQPEEIKAQCVWRGKIYKSGEIWTRDRCIKCSCNNGQITCSRETCSKNATCPAGQKMQHKPGDCCPSCVEEDAVCTVFGDPHYRSFDGRIFDFQGPCKYVLTRDCQQKTFSVQVANDVRYSKAFSWTRSVTFKVDGTKVRLGQHLRVKVGKKRIQLPYIKLGVLSIVQEGYNVLVRTNIGIKLLWDGDSFLEVTVPSEFKNKLCGLCGNFNGDPNDDFQTKKGNVVTNADRFGNSWRVGRAKHCSRPESLSLTSSTEPVCQKNWEARVRAIKECNIIKSPLFRPCHGKVNAAPYFRSCLLDMCECQLADRCYCESLLAYARECSRVGVQIEWRSASGCEGGHCPRGATYTTCASACKRTCRNRKNVQPCRRRCKPGCQCPEGTVLHRNRCILPEHCPT